MTLVAYKNTILVLIMMVVCVISMFTAVLVNSKYRRKYNEIHPVALAITDLFGACAIFAMFFLPTAVRSDIAKFNKATYEEALNSGYEVYINGNLVDETLKGGKIYGNS